MVSKVRLDALLSRLGYCSRKESAVLIKKGRVRHKETNLPFKTGSEKVYPDSVLVDNELLDFPHGILIAFNKPVGVTCSHDEKEGELIYDLLPHRWTQRNPAISSVGRLDKETSGLLILTDNGGIIHQLTSPKHHVDKVYTFTTIEPIPPASIELFASGTLMLEGEKTPLKPAHLEIISPCIGKITLTEGRYHQVRRMLESQGAPIESLHRLSLGKLQLSDLLLAPGEWKEITLSDIVSN